MMIKILSKLTGNMSMLSFKVWKRKSDEFTQQYNLLKKIMTRMMKIKIYTSFRHWHNVVFLSGLSKVKMREALLESQRENLSSTLAERAEELRKLQQEATDLLALSQQNAQRTAEGHAMFGPLRGRPASDLGSQSPRKKECVIVRGHGAHDGRGRGPGAVPEAAVRPRAAAVPTRATARRRRPRRRAASAAVWASSTRRRAAAAPRRRGRRRRAGKIGWRRPRAATVAAAGHATPTRLALTPRKTSASPGPLPAQLGRNDDLL